MMMSFIVFGAQYYRVKNIITFPTKPLRSNNVTFYTIHPNVTWVSVSGLYFKLLLKKSFFSSQFDKNHQPFFIFRITHYYYTPLGFALMIIIGTIVSKFTKSDDLVHPDLISPMMQRYLPKESEKLRYFSVDSTLIKCDT